MVKTNSKAEMNMDRIQLEKMNSFKYLKVTILKMAAA